MKILTRLLIALLSLAAIGFLGVVILAPEKGLELQEQLENLVLGRSEKLDISPVQELSIAYDFPVSEEALGHGLYMGASGDVYTWFRDIGGDLWMPFIRQDDPPCTIGRVAVCGPSGIIKWLEEGVCTGDSAAAAWMIPAQVLEELPEGDYWFAFHVLTPGDEGHFRPYYVSIHDQCTFHTDNYILANRGEGPGGTLVLDRSTSDGFTFRLCNLGDNRITDVWRMEPMPSMNTEESSNYSQSRLSDEDFVVSADGASVTLTQDYLESLIPLYAYYFNFGLGDHSEVSALESDTALVLTDGPISDPPYLEGPETYSLSSGSDYTFTIHLGRCLQFYGPGSFVYFMDSDWNAEMEGDHIRTAYQLLMSELQADETYTIPASVLQAGAERGNASFQIDVLFQVSDFTMCSYWRPMSLLVQITP